MKRHQALVDNTNDSECRYCMEDDETSFHVISECPALARQRLEVFGAFTLTSPLQWSNQVTTFLRNTPIGDLLDLTRRDE